MELDAHLFVCTNRREPGPDGNLRASCGALQAENLRAAVKAAANARCAGKKIRVNAAGCLGHCESGIAAVCYSRTQSSRWLLDLRDDEASREKLLEVLSAAI